MSDLALIYFDPKFEIVVASDTSEYGIGAVILYIFEDGNTKSDTYFNNSISRRKKKTTARESLAIIFAHKKFHKFDHGRKHVLQTDHHPLLSIFESIKGLPTHTANRLKQWGTFLFNYNMKFLPYLPTPLFGQDMTQGQFLSGV